MRLLIGISDPARHLFHVERLAVPPVQSKRTPFAARPFLRRKAEHRGRGVPVLTLTFRKINRPPEQAARRPGLEPLHRQAHVLQRITQSRHRITHPPTHRALQPHMHQPPHKRPRRHHHGPCPIAQPEVRLHARHLIVLDQNPHRISLQQLQARGVLQHPLQPELVSLLVALGARRLHARTFPRIQHAELDPRRVRILTHHAPQRIDLPHHMTLGQPTNRRVAGHLPDRVEVLRQNPRRRPQPRCRQSRLHPRMPGP